MTFNELSNEEKLDIIKKRLDIELDINRSGVNLNLCNMTNGCINLSIFDEITNNGLGITLDDEALDKLFKFLKQRHALKKELNHFKK